MNEKLNKAKNKMLLTEPFFSAVLMQVKQVSTKKISTIGTDGETLFYNPDFIDKLSINECVGALIHESLHIVLQHPLRKKSRDHVAWNVACDAVVNRIILESGYLLPSGVVEAAEIDVIAEKLYDESKNSIDVDKLDILDTADFSEEKKAMLEEKWGDFLRVNAGQMPDCLRREFEKISTQKTDWEILLKRYVATYKTRETRESWATRSRRFHDLILPGKIRVKKHSALVAVDTSASIDEKTLSEYVNKAIGIAGVVGRVDLVFFDAACHDFFEDVKKNKIEKMTGGGGTDFSPIFEKYDNKSYDIIIVLTDLEGTFPSARPKTNTIFVTNNIKNPPFGVSLNL